MSATLLGTVGEWGPSADETGLIVSNVEHDYTTDENLLKNRGGCDQGVALYNERAEITLEGEIPASSPMVPVVAGTLALANAIDFGYLQSSAGGSNIVKGVNKGMPREGWQTLRINGTFHPFF